MRYGSLFLIGTLVFILSCSNDTVTAGPTGPGPLPVAAATVINEHVVNQPFELGDWFIECPEGGVGEFVNFAGVLTSLVHVTRNENRLVVNATGNLRLSGEGLSTGDQYLFRDVFASTENQYLFNGQLSHTAAGTTAIIAPGPGNNTLFHLQIHFTRNANGETTVDVVKFSVECK